MRMKRLLAEMEPLLLDMFKTRKEGTRLELFERSGLNDWHEFKRFFDALRAQDMFMGHISRHAVSIDAGKIPWVLSRHGRKVVQNFCFTEDEESQEYTQAEGLYVNLNDEQEQSLDNVEHAVREALSHQCEERDILDAVQSILKQQTTHS